MDSGFDALVTFHMDVGILKSQDSLPFHLYSKLYVWVDTFQVFSKAFSVVTFQLGGKF